MEVELDHGFKINYIGLNDFIKNKKAVGRSQDITDIQEIGKAKTVKRDPGKKRGRPL
jgi:predicted nucleotidyltransferase